jgi:hypothetical protein
VPQDACDSSPTSLASVPAVQLLSSHARQFRAEFCLDAANSHAVAGLTRYVDGIPSALEAVASWFGLYESEELCAQLAAERALFTELARLDGSWSMADDAVDSSGLPVAAAHGSYAPCWCAASYPGTWSRPVEIPRAQPDPATARPNLTAC